MRRLFTTIFILFALLVTSTAQASLWHWAGGGIAGTLQTEEPGYATGSTYTLTEFSVTNPGATPMKEGIYYRSPDFPEGEDFGVGFFGFVVDEIWQAGPFGPGSGGFWSFGNDNSYIICEGPCFWRVNFDDTGENFEALSGWRITLVPANAAAPVPLPAAAWLFGSALLGFAGIARKKQK